MSHEPTNHEPTPPMFPAQLFEEVHFLASATLRNELTDQQAARFEQLVVENRAARRLLASYLLTNASLRQWATTEVARLGPSSAVNRHDSEIELSVSTESIRSMLEEETHAARREAERRARIERLAAEKFLAFQRQRDQVRRSPSNTIPWNRVYATVASVAAALILLIFWMLPDPEPVVVASIDNSVDARWDDPSLSTAPGTPLFTRGNLVLAHGVVKIAFDGGAKAIVEAPSTFELLSDDSARLVQGRLVGLVPHGKIQLTIKTPRASIVDLGTEFGVEVDRQQVTHLHVFKGHVLAATLDARGKTAQQQTVHRNEAVDLRPKTGAIKPVPMDTASRFVRRLLPLYSTGVGLAVGDADPHWRIVASESDPGFVPQQAIVTAPHDSYVSNNPRKSQWISLAAQHMVLPPEAQYTFRMTWTLADMPPDRLRGSFRADDLVTAIRVNGTSISVPQHVAGSFKEGATPLAIDGRHLKAGQNIIEFDVRNTGKRDGVEHASPLALWVRWKGGEIDP